MRKLSIIGLCVAFCALAAYLLIDSDSSSSKENEGKTSPEGREAFELMRLADPETGEIPSDIRRRELAYAQKMPIASAGRDGLSFNFNSIGPYNVGGRTRAFAVDVNDDKIYLAGGVSGGMWRSADEGESWERVTARMQHAAVSCIAQDLRPGKTNTWYYGSGEVDGNSASKSFSAYYRGNGIYKSVDNGQTWVSLASTVAPPHEASVWDAVFNVVVDKTRNDSNIVFATTNRGVMRSNDGGESWSTVLGGNTAEYVYLIQNHSGVLYASISSDAAGLGGVYRSENGLNWVKINANGDMPGNHARTIIASPDSSDHFVFFFSHVPGGGVNSMNLRRYEYLSGDGSGAGGSWENRSSGLANLEINLFGGYCQVLTVKPDNPDVIFVGGTNLYRSTNGFVNGSTNRLIGGYNIAGNPNFSYRSGEHYPDQQTLAWHPNDPNVLFSANDGGIYRANNCLQQTMTYDPLNNGFVTAQFYGIAIDHETAGSREVMGGLQDRGTFWTNESDPDEDWSSIRGADGAYCAVEDGGAAVYMSTQYANIVRARINENGTNVFQESVMPPNLQGGYLFVHPFTLDPVDNNTMYLPRSGTVLRNTNLSNVDFGGTPNWSQIASVNGTVTAISASENVRGVVYFGTSNGNIFRIDSAHTFNTGPELVSQGITKGGYTSCIAIDPEDAERVIVVYSNYNTVSAWLTEDGGDTWEPIEGNLRGEPEPGVPPVLYYIGNGPSFRWAEITKTEGNGEVVLLGTSVGLFSTSLVDGDSTEWRQEGVNSIGNVVVDMIDYRAVDRWVVAGTHGNGMYASTMNFTPPASVEELDLQSALSVYPNPATDQLFLGKKGDQPFERVQVYSMAGQLMRSDFATTSINVSKLPSGIYTVIAERGTQASKATFLKK